MDFATYRSTKIFASLNGLRCLSILAVIWHHCGGDIADIPVLRTGYLGVALFFVISGFLITTLLLRERDQHGDISLRRFYARRSLRIFPLYYSVIALYAALVLLVWKPSAYGADYLHNLPSLLTYTSNWFVPLGSELYFAWSLAAEEQFYLMWPMIERFTRGKWPVLVASTLLVISVAASTPMAGQWLGTDNAWHTLLVYLPAGLLVGVLLAHLLHDKRGYQLMRSLLGGRFGSLTAFALLLTGLVALDHIARPWGLILVIGLMALLIAACVIREDHFLAGILRTRLVNWIGTVSYGMYLLHMLVLVATTKLLDKVGYNTSLLRFVLVAGITVLVASASYRWFESIFLRQKQRFAAHGFVTART